MKEINKLVDLVNHNLSSNFGVIDLSGEIPDPGKEQQLYNGVLKGDFYDDEVTAKGMYQSNIYDQRFRMLKSRLRYKLYELLYHLDFETPHFNFTTQKKLECVGNLHKARILYELGEWDMAEKQYNKVIVLATECQFTKEWIEALELKRKVLAKEHKPTDFELTIKELEQLRKTHQLESEAEDLFLRIELLLSKSIHSRNVSGDAAKEAIDQMQAIYDQTQSYGVFEKIHYLRIWLFMLEGEFEKLDKYLTDTYSNIGQLKVSSERFDHAFHFQTLAKNHLILGQFDQGQKAVLKGLEFLDKSTEAWFFMHEVGFLIAVHRKDYSQAYQVLAQVMKNPNYGRASESIANRWKLLKLYLNFAMPDQGIQKRIRFYDIYEASQSYFKELKGYRISLYFLEFIHNLNKESYDLAVSKLDELEAYFYKNLNDPGKNQREKQLLKMLKVLKSSNFSVAETKDNVQAYYAKMGEKKIDSHFSDFEIIPYEDLWELVLNAVDSKMHRVR